MGWSCRSMQQLVGPIGGGERVALLVEKAERKRKKRSRPFGRLDDLEVVVRRSETTPFWPDPGYEMSPVRR